MLTFRNKWNIFQGFVALGLVAAPGFAAQIAVANYSFETLPSGGLPYFCGVGCSFNEGAIPGWSLSGAVGQFRPGVPPTGYFTSLSDGPTNAFVNTGMIFQTVGETVVLNEVYTLQVDLGYRLDAAAFVSAADLLINGTRYFATGTAPVQGTFGTFTVKYKGSLADVGKAITIELQATDVISQANFDNVRLDGTHNPEPASFLLIAPALLVLSALRRRRTDSRTQA